jgi:hypothetical protein
VSEIVNTQWLIEALSPRIVGSTLHTFQKWSNGGAVSHTVNIPAGPSSSYKATYLTCPILQPSAVNATPIRTYFTTSTPTLTWARVSWAASYGVQVDNQTNFSDPEYVNDTIAATTFSVTTTSLDDCVYYWRVRARDANGVWGSWSVPEAILVDAP